MKKVTLYFIAMCIGAISFAQVRPAAPAKIRQTRPLPQQKVDDRVSPVQAVNSTANSKAVLDDIMGTSRYDNQSNASCGNRIYEWPDGSIAATWTKGMADPGYSDRGTGYNYFDGTSWGPQPGARIETLRAGWPSVAPWNGNGEIVISHQSATKPMIMNTRPVKGTGAWTQTIINAPTGASGLDWPRMITNGPNNNYIHILVCAGPTSLGGSVYQGLDAAILYYRSLDGGVTWDKFGEILPQMTSADYNGFGGDDYAWASPRGDTLAFVVGGTWSDVFIMKSVDNGNTWTKTVVMPHYYTKNPPNQVTPRFICSDGAVACEMDSRGRTHVAFGRMRALDDGTGHKYMDGTDGLVYWNSDMPTLDTAVVSDLETLINAGLCIGYVADNGTDTIVDWPKYQVSLSSFPQITIDPYDNIYFLWSGLTVGNPSPDPYNYRHIWGRAWFHDQPQWGEMVDLNSGVFYMFQEYVWPNCARTMLNDKIKMITQTSSQPGSNIRDETIPVHDVNIEYREVPGSTFWPAGTEKKEYRKNVAIGSVFPNPARSNAAIDISTLEAVQVSIIVNDLAGRRVLEIRHELSSAGKFSVAIPVSELKPGVYVCSLTAAGTTATRKLVVE